ncbi:sensor histidine kinase [Lichenicoccus sp.]|uniref:sensor histidine kinase n=1 Tax=Lichenicoccus sp. TaxID=2781899 RepID=UPI003D0BBB75
MRSQASTRYLASTRSLGARLWLVWLLATLVAVLVGILLVQFARNSDAAVEARADAELAHACDLIHDSFAFYATGWAGDGAATAATRRDLDTVLATALAREPAMSGGLWLRGRGVIAARIEPPGAPRASDLNSVAETAVAGERSATLRHEAAGRTTLVAACPLAGPFPGLAAWTATSLQPGGRDRLGLGLAGLALLVLGLAGWLVWITTGWSRRIRGIEVTLQQHDVEALPVLAPTGERELDRIVSALNDAGRRLEVARQRNAALTARVALAERQALLGRMAAGIAHEIRNPLASMRLRAENALHGDAARKDPAYKDRALQAGLVQIARIDVLVTELLTMTERRPAQRRLVPLAAFIEARLAGIRDLAESSGVRLSGTAPAPGLAWPLDEGLIGRALDNLLLNAVQHSPPAGTVRLYCTEEAAGLRFTVTDEGPGVAPALLPDRLFEPFVGDRTDGTGLGLAIARELAAADAAVLALADAGGGAGGGAVFSLLLPAIPA